MSFTEEAIKGWQAAPRTIRRRQPSYSDLAVAMTLTMRALVHLALRQTEGLIASILQLLGLDLSVPDHTTLSRRAEAIKVPRARGGQALADLLGTARD